MRVSSYTLAIQLLSATQTLLVSGHCHHHHHGSSRPTLHVKVFSGYRFSGDVINDFQMRKHKCYNIEQGTSAQFLNPTDRSGGMLVCRENDCRGVCT
ncbi:hypothetical protein AX774_g2819, partial [Zancudomyces culisetae]